MASMLNEVIERYRNSIKNWWVPLLLGIFFTVVGVIVFFRPGESYLAMSLLFGIMVLFSGLMEIYLGIATPAHYGKGWLIAAGIVELLLGILLVAMPALLVSVLPFVLGFWLMFRGFTTIGVASDMMSYKIKGAGWTLAFAILLVICSFLVLANPILGAGAIVIWVGISLIMLGIAMIVSAFHLLSLKKHLKKM